MKNENKILDMAQVIHDRMRLSVAKALNLSAQYQIELEDSRYIAAGLCALVMLEAKDPQLLGLLLQASEIMHSDQIRELMEREENEIN